MISHPGLTSGRGLSFILRPSAFGISNPRSRYAASVVTGLLLLACFPRLDWNFLVWLAVLPLLLAVTAEPRLGRAFLLGYVAGAVFLAGSCYWLIDVMERYGKLDPALSVGVLVLLVLVFAVFFGAFGLMEGWAARRSLDWALVLAPFAWVATELARTLLITGFPWNLLGYAVPGAGLCQLASVTAVYGLSFLAVATSALLAAALLNAGLMGGTKRQVWLPAASWLVLLLVGNWVLAPPLMRPGPAIAYLLQPDVPLDERVQDEWAPWRDPKPLGRLVAASLDAVRGQTTGPGSGAGANRSGEAPVRLIIWAENPAPFYFSRDPVFRAAMENLVRETHAYIVFNTVTFAGSDNTRPKNSAIVLDPSGRRILQYDKIHLVPFGEYVPAWGFPGKIGKITAEVSDFVPGSDFRTASSPDGSIGVFICYEDIFPQLVRRLTPGGPGVLVSISNDSWYDDSPADAQHLAMARFRAIESRRYLLRATNDGITTAIDPYGRVLQSLPRHVERVLAARFAFVSERTFYTAHGDVFAWLCVAATIGALVLSMPVSKRE
jgi:apolipoprotein N-acyltransferase